MQQFWGKDDKTKDNSHPTPSPPSDSNIVAVQNHIYFYNGVDTNTILKLNKTIQETTNMITATSHNLSLENGVIFLHIKSYGGGLFEAFSTVDTIINNEIPIHTIVEGVVASAASLISISGKKRFMQPHAWMMIHQLQSGFWGKYDEILDAKKNADNFMNMLKEMYDEYTKVPPKELKEILKHDLYFNAKKCLEYKMIDKIL